MEQRTRIHAEDGKQEIVIARDFDLPLNLLFRAYVDPDIVAQWMGTKVLKLESRKHGSYEFETSDAEGNVLLRTNGVIAEFVQNEKITRTFEMEDTGFPVQLEFLEFEKISDGKSTLNMKIVFKSVSDRDRMLKLPFARGLNMAHNRLQEMAGKLI